MNPPNDKLDESYHQFVAPIESGRQGGQQSRFRGLRRRLTDVACRIRCAHLLLPSTDQTPSPQLRCQKPPGVDTSIVLTLKATTQNNPEQVTFVTALWERIRRSFPELRIYRVWDKPVGPHPVAMFEVNIFTPMQFGAFIPWLVINRGPLSALVHPNTGDDERDHTQRATWMGERMALDLSIFRRMRQAIAKLKALQAERDETEKTQESG